MLKLSADRLNELFAALDADLPVYLPVKKNGQSNFHRWSADVEYCADLLKTVKSAKDFFFPQSEDLASFQVDGKNITITPNDDPTAPFVVFGVRACDARGMDVLDMVFLTDPVDSFYAAKREAATVITTACGEPEDSCFCGSFGIDATAPGGDVSTWLCGGFLYWKPLTAKGEALTKKLSSLLEEAGAEGDKAVEAQQKAVGDILAQLPLAGIDPKNVDGGQLDIFGSELWGELSCACIGCGTCTFVCPTCQCYDVRDFDTGRDVRRFRCWDSCMYSDFTLMAHGNPRTSQVERFRQRFMHKLVYFPDNNNGVYSCVGCGRCVAKCPISMNIAKVIKALGVKENVRN